MNVFRILLQVDCVNCGALLQKKMSYAGPPEICVGHLDDILIHKSDFEQTDWICPHCGHTSCIGDIDVID